MSRETILITGGTGKLGRILATHFAVKGWKVVITSTNQERALAFKESFPEGENIEVFLSDLSQPDAAKLLVEAILGSGIKINHLVNNARYQESLKVGEDGFSVRGDFIAEYLMHVVAPYELAVNLYANQKDSIRTITNIGSQYGSVAANPVLYDGDLTKSPIQYGVAKAALHHLTKELAVRFSKDNIRVNCVAFGGIGGRVDKAFQGRYSKLAPSGRMLEEQEVVGPLEFLISEASSSITGQTIAADGGWTIW